MGGLTLTGDEGLTADQEPFVMVPVALYEDARLADRDVRLWITLRRWKDGPLGIVPTRGLLARRLMCSPDSIDRAMRNLADAGWMTVYRRYRTAEGIRRENDLASTAGLAQASNEYRLHFAPREAEPSPEPSPMPSPESVERGTPALAGGAAPVRLGGPHPCGWGGRSHAARIEIDPIQIDPNAGLQTRARGVDPTPDPSLPALSDFETAVLKHLRGCVASRGVAIGPADPWGVWWVRRGLTGADVDAALTESEGIEPARWWRHLVAVLERVSREREAGRDPWPSATPRIVPLRGAYRPRGFDPQAAQRAMRPRGGQ